MALVSAVSQRLSASLSVSQRLSASLSVSQRLSAGPGNELRKRGPGFGPSIPTHSHWLRAGCKSRGLPWSDSYTWTERTWNSVALQTGLWVAVNRTQLYAKKLYFISSQWIIKQQCLAPLTKGRFTWSLQTANLLIKRQEKTSRILLYIHYHKATSYENMIFASYLPHNMYCFWYLGVHTEGKWLMHFLKYSRMHLVNGEVRTVPVSFEDSPGPCRHRLLVLCSTEMVKEEVFLEGQAAKQIKLVVGRRPRSKAERCSVV